MADLTAQAKAAIARLHRVPAWVRSSEADLDVAIVGGGQSGAGIAFALARAGIVRTRVFDAAPEDRTGIWRTAARMETLRTGKTISGLDQGVPELTFPHWFDGLEGDGAFDQLTRIPTSVWADYVDWLRATFGVAVDHGWRLASVEPHEAGLALTFDTGDGPAVVTARRLVLATGVDGLGAPFVPEAVAKALPRDRYHHTGDEIDFSQFAGRDLLVIGAASSAFDAASTALEAGAPTVHLLARANDIATANPFTLAANPPLYQPFRDLPDPIRWKLITEGRARGHAPQWSIDRAARHDNFHLHLGTSLDGLRFENGRITIATDADTILADHLIAATGYATDLSLRPELARLADAVRLWRDVPAAAAGSAWASFPYLDRDLAFLPKASAPDADWVSRIHAFNYGAVLSHGHHVGDIGSHAACVARVVEGLSARLFEEEAAAHLSASGISGGLGHGARPNGSGDGLTHVSVHPSIQTINGRPQAVSHPQERRP